MKLVGMVKPSSERKMRRSSESRALDPLQRPHPSRTRRNRRLVINSHSHSNSHPSVRKATTAAAAATTTTATTTTTTHSTRTVDSFHFNNSTSCNNNINSASTTRISITTCRDQGREVRFPWEDAVTGHLRRMATREDQGTFRHHRTFSTRIISIQIIRTP